MSSLMRPQCCSKQCFLTVLLSVTCLYVIVLNKYPLFTYEADVEEVWLKESRGYYGDITQHNKTKEKLMKNLCPLSPPSIGKSEPVINTRLAPPGLTQIQQRNSHVLRGGEWLPRNCTARQKVAVIVPYRDRWQHLLQFLSHVHPILQTQQCHYRIFISEQMTPGPFNKGRVMNHGFIMASKIDDWDCYIFHDVDLIPETASNLYRCAENPLHLSAGVDSLRYTLMYQGLTGGVLAMTPAQFKSTNGFSNNFWGWGGEDDDMDKRINEAGMTVVHTSTQRGRYKMMPHAKRKASTERAELLLDKHGWTSNGLNSLETLDTQVMSIQELPLYTNISVNVGSQPAASSASAQSWQKWFKDKLLITLYGY